MAEHLVLVTVATPEALGEVHRTLDLAWARHCHVPATIRANMAIAAAEIGANIVKHADQGRQLPVRMEVDVTPHQVTVVFADEGIPATVDLDAVSMPQASAKQGRGIALASAVLAKLSYRRDGARNYWTLESRRFD